MSVSLKFTTNPPRVRAGMTVPQSLATATWTVIPWGGTDGSDYEAMRQGTRIVVPAAGRYAVAYQVGFEGNSTGHRFTQLRKNAVGQVISGIGVDAARVPAVGSSSAYVRGGGDVAGLIAGDYLEVFAWQSSGGSLALNAGTGETWISVRWVAID